MSSRLSIALVGRTSIVREGLAHVLSQAGWHIAHSVASIADLITDPGQARDELGLILIEDADWTLIAEQVIALRRCFAKAHVATICDGFDLRTMVEALRAGVCGFIVAETSGASLVESLRLIAMGERVLPTQLADNLPLSTSRQEYFSFARHEAGPELSALETDLMRCLITGYSNKVIARQLNITEASVKVHVKAMLRKIPVRNRTQAAVWGAHLGFTALEAEHQRLPLPRSNPPVPACHGGLSTPV